MTGRTALALTGSVLAHAALLAALRPQPLGRGRAISEIVRIDVVAHRGAVGLVARAPGAGESDSPPAKPARLAVAKRERSREATSPIAAPPAAGGIAARGALPSATPAGRPERGSALPPPSAGAVEEASSAPPPTAGSVEPGSSASGPTAGTVERRASRAGPTTEEAEGGSAASVGIAGEDAASATPSGEDLRDAIHRKLAAAARACYPAAARRFRLRGSARLQFCLDGKGGAGAVRLEESSGSPLLDRAATECVIPGAQPLPGNGCYALSVDFTAP